MEGQALTQAEIDILLGTFLPGGTNNIVPCVGCLKVTKRIEFDGRGSLRMKVVSRDGKDSYYGKMTAGTTICLGCGFVEKRNV